MSRKGRETLRLSSGQAIGHPAVVVASANSRFLAGLSALFGMTGVFWGLRRGWSRVLSDCGGIAGFLSPLRGWVIVLFLPTACAPSTSLRAGCGLRSFAASRLGPVSWACGATEVVPFPVVAPPKSSEGWGRGISCLAKEARHGAPAVVVVAAKSRFPSTPLRAGSHRAFSPIRNDKSLLGACGGTVVAAFPVVVASRVFLSPLRGWVIVSCV